MCRPHWVSLFRPISCVCYDIPYKNPSQEVPPASLAWTGLKQCAMCCADQCIDQYVALRNRPAEDGKEEAIDQRLVAIVERLFER